MLMYGETLNGRHTEIKIKIKKDKTDLWLKALASQASLTVAAGL